MKVVNVSSSEEWADVVGFEGLYQISNFGRVKSLSRKVEPHPFPRTTRERIMKDYYSDRGYIKTVMNDKGRRVENKVHRLVAIHFIPNPENKPDVNHKDGNKANNHFENLEWVTKSENIIHSCKMGLHNIVKYPEMRHKKRTRA